MPTFTHNGIEIKYHAVAGYVVQVWPDSKHTRALCAEHMRINYPPPKFELRMADRCVHSDNVQQNAL